MRQRKRHSFHHPSPIAFFSSVRVRLTLWYLVTITIILFLTGWSLYGYQTHLNDNALDNLVETQLYQDVQPATNVYKQALLDGQSLASQRIKLSTNEVVLLLRSDRSILDRRGSLTSSAIEQLQARVGSSQAVFNITMPQTHTHSWGWWWSGTDEYRFLVVPILNKDTRIAILVIGLPRQGQGLLPSTWVPHGIILLLISFIGGYWVAGRALRPV